MHAWHSCDRYICERLAPGHGALSTPTTVFEAGDISIPKEDNALIPNRRYGREKHGTRKINMHFH